jgi:hypothetical protein
MRRPSGDQVGEMMGSKDASAVFLARAVGVRDLQLELRAALHT